MCTDETVSLDNSKRFMDCGDIRSLCPHRIRGARRRVVPFSLPARCRTKPSRTRALPRTSIRTGRTDGEWDDGHNTSAVHSMRCSAIARRKHQRGTRPGFCLTLLDGVRRARKSTDNRQPRLLHPTALPTSNYCSDIFLMAYPLASFRYSIFG